MSSPFIGQIVPVAFNFAPRNYLFCNGQILSIAQNTAFFALIGTTYGGNGQTTYAVPDLRSRSMVHSNNGGAGPGLSAIQWGQVGGTESVTLSTSQLPQHTHTATFNGSTSTLNASTVAATTQGPVAGAVLGRAKDNTGTVQPFIYAPTGSAASTALAGLNVAGTVTNSLTGSSTPVPIRDPYLGINICIAQFGIFPARN
jgi:microcystin-dependent protein